jgi:hypothetical protein
VRPLAGPLGYWRGPESSFSGNKVYERPQGLFAGRLIEQESACSLGLVREGFRRVECLLCWAVWIGVGL